MPHGGTVLYPTRNVQAAAAPAGEAQRTPGRGLRRAQGVPGTAAARGASAFRRATVTVTTHSCVTVRFIRTRAPCPAPVLNTGPQDCLALSAGPAEPDAEIPASGKEQRSKRLSFAPSLLFPSFLGVLPPAGPLPAPITRPGVCAPPPQTPVIADGVALRSCEEARELEQPPDRPAGLPVKGP